MPRGRSWADRLIDDTLTAAISTRDLLVNSSISSDNITTARLVMRLAVFPASLTNQVDTVQRVDMAIGVATPEAFAVAGGAGLPDPRVNTQYPARGWLWKSVMWVAKEHGTSGTGEIMVPDKLEADIGAMRKVDKGILYWIAVKTVVGGTAEDLDMSGLVRVLCFT